MEVDAMVTSGQQKLWRTLRWWTVPVVVVVGVDVVVVRVEEMGG